MTVIQDLRQRLQARIPRFRGTSRRTVAGAAVVAAISGLLLTSTPAIAQPKPVGEYIEIDFTAAAPKSYSHLVGGGAYDTGKSNVDTVQQLEGKDFVCGDIVSFMTKIKMNDGEAAGYGAIDLCRSQSANRNSGPSHWIRTQRQWRHGHSVTVMRQRWSCCCPSHGIRTR